MPSDCIHYQLAVRGRVQGVGYRAFVMRSANSYGLKGYVKNKPDGSVLIEVEGFIDVLDLFISDCKKGPHWSRVEEVKVTSAPVEGYSDFKVRY